MNKSILDLPDEIQLEIMERLRWIDLTNFIKSNNYTRKLFKRYINTFKKLFPPIKYPNYSQYILDLNENEYEPGLLTYKGVVDKYSLNTKGDSLVILYTSGNYKLVFKGLIIFDEQRNLMINEYFNLFDELPPSFINNVNGINVYFNIPLEISSKFEVISVNRISINSEYRICTRQCNMEIVTFYYKNTPFCLIVKNVFYSSGLFFANYVCYGNENSSYILTVKNKVFSNISRQEIDDIEKEYEDLFKNIPKCNIFTIQT